MTEGVWEKIYCCFEEVPKDSCILVSDQDDIIKMKKNIGDHQIIVGGIDLILTRIGNYEAALDKTKKIIDACAPGGGFMLTTDKAWVAKGDVNKTLIDVTNAAHEYSKK